MVVTDQNTSEQWFFTQQLLVESACGLARMLGAENAGQTVLRFRKHINIAETRHKWGQRKIRS